MLDRKTPPRLTIDLTDSQAAGLGRIQWGMRKPLFHTIINQLNKAMDTADPEKVVGAIISGELHLKDIL